MPMGIVDKLRPGLSGKKLEQVKSILPSHVWKLRMPSPSPIFIIKP
jgi:hypothetical protein